MSRAEPPSLATWILEHLTSGDRDEAIAGDLLEVFHGGRSKGWYWREVVTACAVSWFRSLRAHLSLLIFACAWSMLAPGWKVFIDGIESAVIFDRISQLLGGFWILPAFAGWLVLNSTFLWVGIVVYILALSSCGKTFHGKNVRQAFLMAPLVFAPVFAAWFALCMLDWTFPFANETLATTRWGQVADFRMLSNAMRFPYFIALLCALWNAVPSKYTSQLLPADSLPIESSTQSGTIKLESTLDSDTLKRFFGFMVGAGLINAMLAGMLLCRLPEIHSPSFSALFVRSILQIVLSAIAGVGGSWLYWKNHSSPLREDSPLPFPLFALVCSAGWIWVPSMMLLSEQVSPFTAAVAMIAAFALASGLRSVTYCVFAPALSSADFSSYDNDLFAESLYQAPAELHGYVIAFGLFAGGAALLIRSNWTAVAFLATSAAVFAWKRTVPRSRPSANRETYQRAALRLALVAIPAMLVMMWAMLDGIAHRNLIAQAALNAGEQGASGKNADANKKSKNSASGPGGFESLILWPFPEKKEIVPPIKSLDPFLALGTAKPLVIRFDGVYRYVQPPDKTPGPNAHKARGTPLALNIEATNAFPLLMDAHQELLKAIPLDRCREIDVEVENRDNHAGLIAIGLLLGDEASRQKPTLYLGAEPLESTKPGHFFYKSAPLSETLRFAVPLDAKIRRFSEITVLVLPDIEHRFLAPKIAVEQFQIVPR